MKKEDVPQDNATTYSGHKKVIYATNNDGGYEKVESSGWESEEFVTLMAVEDLNKLAGEAYQRVQAGLSSPLEYHMYKKRQDVLGLSQATGFFQWQIRRHLKPKVFLTLKQKKLQIYSDALGINIAELQAIPDKAPDSLTLNPTS